MACINQQNITGGGTTNTSWPANCGPNDPSKRLLESNPGTKKKNCANVSNIWISWTFCRCQRVDNWIFGWICEIDQCFDPIAEHVVGMYDVWQCIELQRYLGYVTSKHTSDPAEPRRGLSFRWRIYQMDPESRANISTSACHRWKINYVQPHPFILSKKSQEIVGTAHELTNHNQLDGSNTVDFYWSLITHYWNILEPAMRNYK